ncbi:MAG TPA: hypothetical protein VGJ92_03115 [Methanocella sp.]|jgi:hypothetical protein
MSRYHRVLFLVALALAVATAGCTIPGTSPQGNEQGVLSPISPTPTATPMPTPTATTAPTATPTVTARSTVIAPAGDSYSHTYSWEYKNVDWSFTAVVQKLKYDLFKAKPHSDDLRFSSYAVSSEDRDLIGSAVAQIRQGGAGFGFTRYDEAVNLITFVQSVTYVDDHPAGSPHYPLETLVEAQGDCKDKTVLAAALLQAAGFDVALIRFPGHPGHLGLGINIGADGASFSLGSTRYFYVELTSPGWDIGELPEELKGVDPSIDPVVKNPELQVTITAAAVDSAAQIVDYRAQYTITNSGPGVAKHLVLRVHAMALRQGDNVYYDPERTVDLGDLGEGQTISADILVMIPAGESSRIVCIVSGENADPVTASTGDFVAGT